MQHDPFSGSQPAADTRRTSTARTSGPPSSRTSVIADTSRAAHVIGRGGPYDVVVVGARAGGAAVAMLLARCGVRTLLLDRGAFGGDTLSTHALMRAGVMQLSRWGLLDQLVAAGTPPIRQTTFRYGDERVVISIKPAQGIDALYAPRRTVLDPLLVESAAAAGAVVQHHALVTDLIRRDGRVAGVRVSIAGCAPIEVPSRLVIGADGIRSTVAAAVGAEVTRVGRSFTACTYGYWRDLETSGFEWVFRSDASSGVIPTNDGAACVFAAASPQRLGRGSASLIETIVGEGAPEIATRLRRASAPASTRLWRGHPGYVRRASGPGWALVGDAGYYKDPLSAHGITDALRDAELLARAVVGGFDDPSTLADRLAAYEAERDRLSLPLFDVVDRIASQEWDHAEIADLLLRLSSAMAHEVDMLAALPPMPFLMSSAGAERGR